MSILQLASPSHGSMLPPASPFIGSSAPPPSPALLAHPQSAAAAASHAQAQLLALVAEEGRETRHSRHQQFPQDAAGPGEEDDDDESMEEYAEDDDDAADGDEGEQDEQEEHDGGESTASRSCPPSPLASLAQLSADPNNGGAVTLSSGRRSSLSMKGAQLAHQLASRRRSVGSHVEHHRASSSERASTLTFKRPKVSLTAAAPGFKKKPASGASEPVATSVGGSSCHQCKSRRNYADLTYCSSSLNKKNKNAVCRKKFCDRTCDESVTRMSCPGLKQASRSASTHTRRFLFCRDSVAVTPLLADCLFESDGRVLTDSGFLFLPEVERRLQQGEQVLYACYDQTSLALEYRTGKLVLSDAPEYVVNFTEKSTQPVWDAKSDEYGAASGVQVDAHATGVSMRVTPDHEMFVQYASFGTRNAANGRPQVRDVVVNKMVTPPSKIAAKLLTPDQECACPTRANCVHTHDAIRFTTRAKNGVVVGHKDGVMSIRDRAQDSPVVRLNINKEDQVRNHTTRAR